MHDYVCLVQNTLTSKNNGIRLCTKKTLEVPDSSSEVFSAMI